MRSTKLLKTLWIGTALFTLTGCGMITNLAQRLPFQKIQQALKPTAALVQVEPSAEAPLPPSSPSQPAAPGILPEEQAFESIFERINPSVVSINVVIKSTGSTNDTSPFGLPSLPGFPDQSTPVAPPPNIPLQAQGSGFVYSTDGYIITNNHVVDSVDKIVVTFADGTQAAAKLVGQDPDSDLAVIKVTVDASMLVPVKFGDSDLIKVGQVVVALGNPFGLQNSMSTGIVSGLGRLISGSGSGANYSIPDVIQTDAAINPGNSGGPLVNLRGEVIGVNTAIESPIRASSGVGYAVPSDIVQMVVPALIKNGSVQHPWLGISGTTLNADIARAMKLDPNQRGVLISTVTKDGPAEKAGIRPSNDTTTIDGIDIHVGGDVIVSIQNHPVKVFDDLLAFVVRHTQVGDQVTLKIIRDGKPMDVQLTMAPRPRQ